MKKLFLALLLSGTALTYAQAEKDDNRNENDQDHISQLQQQPAQVAIERSARIEAQRIQNEKTVLKREKKLAKQKKKQDKAKAKE
jgi:hypothetical protein